MDRETGQARDAAGVPRIHMDGSVGDAARLLARSGTGVLLVVDGHGPEATVVGLLTERDIFRALSARGPDVYGHCVWLITEHDFPAIDVTASPRDRLKAFCDRKVDHIALMDGFRVSGVLSIWDCAGAGLRA
ncbi:CBS domain-containing protein [Methylobacterium gnaphalii]|uniref:CBS domain-containing protein n=1 Tax=Methylobacterium gnaphalii TaxID=1010610 RepID=A0A512JDX2_9HYPH|nr:CBS domain-containing protein [Methylobacterium gnaphalii]GEP08160.1 hypothetical protein MGN01_00050 [Methylobacterium gnaphalii]GJD68243.1 hypothetical protein MMMDOFMJ_1162 [Methylobacterium gnaphalii]GLS51209.1 hypothetical protein GCM10007885_40630 [Methylobacterium gnaphalii]